MRKYCHLFIVQKLPTRWAGFSLRPHCTMSTFRAQWQRLGSRGLHTTPPSSTTSTGWPLISKIWAKTRMFVAGATAIGGTFIAIAHFRKEVVVPANDAFKKMSFSLAKARPKFSEKVGPSRDYVSRPSIEKKVLDVFEKTSLQSGSYFVMYGSSPKPNIALTSDSTISTFALRAKLLATCLTRLKTSGDEDPLSTSNTTVTGRHSFFSAASINTAVKS